MGSIYGLKEVFSKMYKLLDAIDESGNVPDLDGNSLSDVFKIEMHSFFMYLSASDGKILPQERDFMNTLFDTNMSIQDYIKFINENDIYSTDFEERVPLALKITTLFDAKMSIAASIAGEEFDAITPMLINLYLEAGKAFISCDGDVDDQEVEDLKTYVSNMADNLTQILENNISSNDEDDDEEIGYIGKKKGSSSKTSSEMSVSKNLGNKYGPSIYKVGTDIPAGRYKVFPIDDRGYYAICEDANCDEIIENDNFNYQAYIDIHYGSFLELTRCYAVPIDDAPMHTDKTYYGSGEYLVGKEIAAGEYRLVADNGGRGYYSIERFVGDGSRDIDSNNNFTNASYVNIRNGQILKLSRCSISL